MNFFSFIHFQLELENVQEFLDIVVADDIVQAFVRYTQFPFENIDQSVRNNSIRIVVVTMLNNHEYDNTMMPNGNKVHFLIHSRFE